MAEPIDLTQDSDSEGNGHSRPVQSRYRMSSSLNGIERPHKSDRLSVASADRQTPRRSSHKDVITISDSGDEEPPLHKKSSSGPFRARPPVTSTTSKSFPSRLSAGAGAGSSADQKLLPTSKTSNGEHRSKTSSRTSRDTSVASLGATTSRVEEDYHSLTRHPRPSSTLSDSRTPSVSKAPRKTASSVWSTSPESRTASVPKGVRKTAPVQTDSYASSASPDARSQSTSQAARKTGLIERPTHPLSTRTTDSPGSDTPTRKPTQAQRERADLRVPTQSTSSSTSSNLRASTHDSDRSTATPKSTKAPSMTLPANLQRSTSSMTNGNRENPPKVSAPVSKEPSETPASDVNSKVSIEYAEKILEKYLEEMHDVHEALIKRTFAANRRCFQRGQADTEVPEVPENPARGPTSIPSRFLHQGNPFAKVRQIQKPSLATDKTGKNMVQFTRDFYPNPNTSKSQRSFCTAPITRLRSSAVVLPPFKSYVSLKQNVLAENNRKLIYWPYFGDDEDNMELREELETRFDALIDHRPLKVLQNQKSRKLRPWVIPFLQEIGISIEDVLRYLLDPRKPKLSDELLASKDASHQCDFSRDKRKWKILFKKLPELDETTLHNAAVACHVFHNRCDLSLWFVARDSKYAQTSIENILKDRGPEPPTTFRESACRVCHLSNCPFHGEIHETPQDDDEDPKHGYAPSEGPDEGSGTGSDADSDWGDDPARSPKLSARQPEDSTLESDSESTDTDHSDINFKTLVNAPPKQHPVQVGMGKPAKANYWLQNSKTHLLHERHPFYPCSHDGSCEDAQCSCYSQGIVCEKTCSCSMACRRRFRGCTCARVARACFQDKRCECFLLNRECDQDLCGVCGAAEILDPVNRYSRDLVGCGNCGIQRNVPKRTLMGHSEVQGFGLYTGQPVRAHEYLGEYKGEVITKGEADRRGTIYQHLATNYLFNLNASQEVDSTRSGNKFRFINNSSKEGTINCYAKPMLANTVTRIGMYAKRDIGMGEELFFNYGYPPEAMQNFWEKGEKPPASSKPKLKLPSNKKSRKIPKAGAAAAAAAAAATAAAAANKKRRGRPLGSTKAAALLKAERLKASQAVNRAAGASNAATTTLTSRPRQRSTSPGSARGGGEITAHGRRRPDRDATRARQRQQAVNLEDFMTSEDHVRQVFQDDEEEADGGFEPDESDEDEDEDDEDDEDDVVRPGRRGVRKRKWSN